MKLLTCVLSTVLLISASSNAFAEQGDYQLLGSWPVEKHEEWLTCQVDDECMIITTSSCGFMFPVNRKYAEQASDLANKDAACLASPTYPMNTVSKCMSNRCALVYRRHQ
jgi:hypothetical protein